MFHPRFIQGIIGIALSSSCLVSALNVQLEIRHEEKSRDISFELSVMTDATLGPVCQRSTMDSSELVSISAEFYGRIKPLIASRINQQSLLDMYNENDLNDQQAVMVMDESRQVALNEKSALSTFRFPLALSFPSDLPQDCPQHVLDAIPSSFYSIRYEWIPHSHSVSVSLVQHELPSSTLAIIAPVTDEQSDASTFAEQAWTLFSFNLEDNIIDINDEYATSITVTTETTAFFSSSSTVFWWSLAYSLFLSLIGAILFDLLLMWVYQSVLGYKLDDDHNEKEHEPLLEKPKSSSFQPEEKKKTVPLTV